MSIELDPREVLAHLHELGYRNVTPEQLEEFMKDLRKLIKHDMNKRKVLGHLMRADDPSSTLPSTTDESGASSPPLHKPKLHSHPEGVGSASYNFKNEASCSSSESSLVPTRRVLRECTKHAVQAGQEKGNIPKDKSTFGGTKVPPKPTKSCDCLWRRIGCKCCDENYQREQNSMKTKSKENMMPPRPKSSFIRTWQSSGQSRPGRCDPVTLYHQYQQMWKQQKLPGENSHSDLRWTIRERMLGQEPHPRSCNCDCRCCPCKLNEQDFSANPKRVSSKILPRGPFHVEGLVKGPMAFEKGKGEFSVKQRRIEGTFELKSCSESDQNQGDKSKHERPHEEHREVLADWVPVSKSHLVRPQQIEEYFKSKKSDSKTNINIKSRTEEPKVSRNHNKASCRYCGLIHYVLNSDSISTDYRRSYWPEKFTVKPNNEKCRGTETMNSVNESSKFESKQTSTASSPMLRRDKRGLYCSEYAANSQNQEVSTAYSPISPRDRRGLNRSVYANSQNQQEPNASPPMSHRGQRDLDNFRYVSKSQNQQESNTSPQMSAREQRGLSRLTNVPNSQNQQEPNASPPMSHRGQRDLDNFRYVSKSQNQQESNTSPQMSAREQRGLSCSTNVPNSQNQQEPNASPPMSHRGQRDLDNFRYVSKSQNQQESSTSPQISAREQRGLSPSTNVPNSQNQRVSIASSPISHRDERRLNRSMYVPNSQNRSDSDDVFEAVVPINLKYFKGDVKTEIKVPKKCERCKNCESTSHKPLLTVATEVKVNKI